MKSATNELLQRLEQTAWFLSAGKPVQAYAEEVQFLPGWPQAVEIYTSQTSEDASLEARNALTVQLSTHYHQADQGWNAKVDEIKPVVERLIRSKLAAPEVATQIPSEARKALTDAILWDLLALCMAYEYQDLVPISRYYELVEHWYLVGHFPCGWIGEVPDEMAGAFQMGKLAVL